jgi:hypothetical protein
MSKKAEPAEVFTLPEGRLINQSVFVRDSYTDEKGNTGEPSYKVEIAFPKGDLDAVMDRLLDAADDKWGEGAGDDEDLVIPILDGNKLAKKREDKGKEGAAYKGMDIIRANTKFNSEGDDGPGGIAVYDEDGETEIKLNLNGDRIYPGCMGIAAVTIGFYQTNRGDNAMKFYLSALQRTGEGERLSAPKDHSKLFKPVGRKAGGDTKRKSRKG